MLPFPDNLNPDVPQIPTQPNVFVKAKRKRLAKACDACHKSKRRCDGTAPCSNCFYASKTCTYTDSSGRPVPAPRPFNSERSDPQPSQSYAFYPDPNRYNQHTGYLPNPSSSHQATAASTSEGDSVNNRKRIKNEQGNPIPADDASMDGLISGPSMDRPIPVKLDHSLTRELTNLFFTHCHPARIIIHKPSFSTALSHNLAPRYLVHAICALAAPLSKQSRIRTNPVCFAGKPFAQEAMAIMFDGAGRLICEPNLATAQALCLLQVHHTVTKDKNMYWNTRYHDLALQIVKSLGVYNPEHPLITPLPTPEFIQESLEREAVRRIFWLIHMVNVMKSIYFKRPLAISESELRVRLPADETSFELAVHSTLPEYLHLPPIRTQYASEFGLLIRVLLIYAKVETALDRLTGLKDTDHSINPTTLVHEAEHKIQEWSSGLPSHLNFSKENLSVQQSMFETSSNDGAWCYCCMHIYHASTFIALNNAQQLLQGASPLKVGPQWATDMLDDILVMLGERRKRSLLMSAALWTYAALCGRNDPQLHAMDNDYEEYWGTRMLDLVRSWRSRMAPPKQQLHQRISPPQKYGQNTTLKRRHSEDSDATPPGSQSPNRQSTPSRPSTVSSMHGICNRNSPQPSLHQSSEPSISTLHSHLTQLSDNDPCTDTSHTSSKLMSVRRHSPILSAPNPLREDGRHLIVNELHLRQQISGKDNVGPPISTGLLVSNSHTSLKDSNERHRHTNFRDQHVERPINEYGLSTPPAKTSRQGVTYGEAQRSRRSNSIGSNSSGDGVQSLPSLKASGLLEVSSRRPDNTTQQAQSRNSGISPPMVLHQKHSVSEVPRQMPSTSMPVGLPWLANESR